MLNAYQQQFIRHLERHGARYLVIGGVARFHHEGRATRDLDILIDIGDEGRSAAQAALVDWSAKHPAHTFTRLTPPLPLRPGVQIKFPDDECLYEVDGEIVGILPDDGIDILTSLPMQAFEDLFARSQLAVIGAVTVRVLSLADLLATSK